MTGQFGPDVRFEDRQGYTERSTAEAAWTGLNSVPKLTRCLEEDVGMGRLVGFVMGHARKRRNRAGLAVATALVLATTPASALFLTTYGDFAQMSEAQQEQIVEAAIYEMIHYFVSTKREDSKSVCVGRYFSGSYSGNEGGYGDLHEHLDVMKEQYEAGTLGDGEESYIERLVLKLIKDECGV